MKQISRWMSLMVAVVIVIAMMGVQSVEAAAKGFSVVSVNPTKAKLQKGDSFGLHIEIRQIGKPADQESDIQFDYADFSATSQIDVGNTTSQVLLPTSTSGNQLYIGGLTYLGGDGNITFIIHTQDADAQTVNIKLKVEEVTDGKGNLKLKDTSQVAIAAGETKKVDVLIENTGTSTVKNPSISVGIEGEKVEGITIKNAADFKVSSISAKSSARVSFEIQTSKTIKAGNYKLQFNLGGNVETVSLRVTSEFMPPQLEFSIEGLEEVKPGTAQPIKIKVKNVGDSEAKQVKVELANTEGMAIVDGSNVKYISRIAAKQSGVVNFTINITPKDKQNMLPIKINYAYQNEIGEPNQDKEQYIYIPLKGEKEAANGEVLVQDIIGPGGTVNVGQNFNIKFTLSATQADVKNVKISVAAEDPTAIVPNSQNLFMITEMKKGTKQQYTVMMSGTQDAKSQSYPIKIEVTYDSVTDKEPITFKQYTSVNVHNPKAKEDEKEEEKESKKGQPKVIIGNYKATPTIVKAGEEFELEIGFLNTNTIKSVHNLKANLTIKEQGKEDAGNVFTPVNASNTFYIASLSPEQMITKNITMYTVPTALPKTYQVQLELFYEDDKGNQIEAIENFGIPVQQTTRLEVGEIETDMFTVGMPMPLNISIYNKGKTKISNLMIYTEGEGFSVQENKMFIGNFDSGATEYYSPTIVPEIPGMLKGTIVVEYEDATGEINQMRKEFDFEVMEMMEEFSGDMEEMPFPEDEKNNKLPIVIGIIVIIAAAIVTTVVIRKKRKENKEIEFDLDE